MKSLCFVAIISLALALSVATGDCNAQTAPEAPRQALQGSTEWADAMEGAHGVFQRFTEVKSEQDLVGILDDRASAEFSLGIIFWLYDFLHIEADQHGSRGAVVDHPQIKRKFVVLLQQYGLKSDLTTISRELKFGPPKAVVSRGKLLLSDLAELCREFAEEIPPSGEEAPPVPMNHMLEMNLTLMAGHRINPDRASYCVIDASHVEIKGVNTGKIKWLGSSFRAVKRAGIWELGVDLFSDPAHRLPLL